MELNFFNTVKKSWKFWPYCYLYVKNLWQRMVMFFLGFFQGLQCFKNLWRTGGNIILSAGSKVKVSCVSLFDHCMSGKWILYQPWYLFPLQPDKNLLVQKFPAIRYFADIWEAWRVFSLSVTYWNANIFIVYQHMLELNEWTDKH